jgi:hypothetical protein
MQVKKWAMVAMLAAAVAVTGCKQGKVAEVHHPAKLEKSDQEGIMRVRLEAKAAERLGLQTAPVRQEGDKLVVPYGAIMYDTKGTTWTFTNPEPLVYVRHKVMVQGIEGDRVILTDGPPAGTNVVTVGAAELMGAEHKYGH